MLDSVKSAGWRGLVVARGPIAFGAFLALCMAYYGWSVFSESRRVTDWLLIVPMACIGLVALLVAIVGDVQTEQDAASAAISGDHETAKSQAEFANNQRRLDRISIGVMITVTVFACLIPWLGLDVGTALFVATSLLVQGERRWWVILLTASLTSLLSVGAFKHLLRVQLPTMFL